MEPKGRFRGDSIMVTKLDSFLERGKKSEPEGMVGGSVLDGLGGGLVGGGLGRAIDGLRG